MAVIEWVYSPAGSFWQGNILSASKLRIKFNELQIKMNAFNKGWRSAPRKQELMNEICDELIDP